MKISTSLYNTMLPLVQKQIDAQIHLRDIENTSATIAPADYGLWHEVHQELMSEEKKTLKTRVAVKLAAAGDWSDEEIAQMKFEYGKQKRDIEHAVDHKIYNFSASVNMWTTTF